MEYSNVAVNGGRLAGEFATHLGDGGSTLVEAALVTNL